jgi:hypothetical protein
MLVVLLGLIAIIVALRIRRSEQAKPKLNAGYAVAPHRPGIERDAAAALAERRRRSAHYPLTPPSADLRAPSSETWGTVQAKSVDDQRYPARAEDVRINHPDVVQYL